MTPHEPVRPVTPPAAWIGGKRSLSKLLCSLILDISHEAYGEPFVGMGGVFLRRTARPPAESINDVNRELITLFRILQRHYVAFVEMLRWQLASRAEFQRLAATDPDTLTDLERAARFLFLQRLAFGGKVRGQNFGVDPMRSARFDVTRLAPLLEEVHHRLAGVTIECLPWEQYITRYDRPGMLFYLDPPYWDSETDYGRGVFCKNDFARLAGVLANINGTFLLSINDRPEIRKAFAAFSFHRVTATYSIGTAAAGKGLSAAELVFSNDRKALRRLSKGG